MSELNNGDVTDVLDSFFIDYAIDDDDDEATVKELMKQRSDMNKTVNEWYAKAKAWDKLSESIRECNKEIEVKDGLNALFRTSKKGQIVQRHIDCFESGEPYAKK